MFGTKDLQLDHKVANCIPRELLRYCDVTRPFAFSAEGAWLRQTTRWSESAPISYVCKTATPSRSGGLVFRSQVVSQPPPNAVILDLVCMNIMCATHTGRLS